MKKLIILAGIGVSLLFSNLENREKQGNAELNKNIEIDVIVDATNLSLHIKPFFSNNQMKTKNMHRIQVKRLGHNSAL